MKELGTVGIWGPDGLFHPPLSESCHVGVTGRGSRCWTGVSLLLDCVLVCASLAHGHIIIFKYFL